MNDKNEQHPLPEATTPAGFRWIERTRIGPLTVETSLHAPFGLDTGSGVTIIAHDVPGRTEGRFVWGTHYAGPLTAGGLAEAHNAVVARVRGGQLP